MATEKTTLDNTGETAQRRGPIIGALVIAIVVVYLPYYFLLLPGLGSWLCPGILLSCGLMAVLPFLLRAVAPRAAGFDVQWFPSRWYHWALFLGMVVTLFVFAALSRVLVNYLPVTYTPQLVRPDFSLNPTFSFVIFYGITMVLLGPIAEEIFYRAYLLEQLRRLMHWSVALLLQSLIFALGHLPVILPRPGGYQSAIAAFFYGIILGTWRIRFRSILPLILAHMVLNGAVSIHYLEDQYYWANLAAREDLPCDFAAKIRSSPECRQIYLLTKEPTEKAVPAIIDFFANPDEGVHAYATDVLMRHYGSDAEPYLREALKSSDKKIVDGVLFVINLGRRFRLKDDVRKVVWSADDERIQLSALDTMQWLEDAEGLGEIAEKHPKEKVRQWAKMMLGHLAEKK